MSAPAALCYSKLFYPETEESKNRAETMKIEKRYISKPTGGIFYDSDSGCILTETVLIQGCNQRFMDWQPGARTANGTYPCH
jgi:hypothetical protein